MDSLDQSDFFLGKTEKSAREGFPIWGGNLLLAAKWRNWKMHFHKQETMIDAPVKYGAPVIINLLTDPLEETPTTETWVVHPVLKMVGEFEESGERGETSAHSHGHIRSLHAAHEVNLTLDMDVAWNRTGGQGSLQPAPVTTWAQLTSNILVVQGPEAHRLKLLS